MYEIKWQKKNCVIYSNNPKIENMLYYKESSGFKAVEIFRFIFRVIRDIYHTQALSISNILKA